MEFKFIKCDYIELKDWMVKYCSSLSSPIDSYLEEKILGSQHFIITSNNIKIGYFSINNEELLTQFYIEKGYRYLGQNVFFKLKQMQNLKSAYVPTCDEFFLSHSIDSYKSINNQAYFFKDSGRLIDKDLRDKQVNIRVAQKQDIEDIKQGSGDFFDILDERILREEIYIASKNDIVMGYGIIEKGIIMKNYASIGMFTIEKFRQQGIGRNILLRLKDEAYHNNIVPIAGCWYYNHNSKKTLESAGMYSDTRLLKINY